MAFSRFFSWLGCAREIDALPDTLWEKTLADLPFIARLDAEEKTRLRKLTEEFLAEKEFASAGGLELTNDMRVSIAAQGCLPILNLGLGCYRDWVGIVIYPDEFVIPRIIEDEIGVVHKYDDIVSGEAWEGGPLIISWHDVKMAGAGYNVVIHEFAHKLDMLNGDADGIPPLPADIVIDEWKTALLAAYEDFCAKVDDAEEQAARVGEEIDCGLPIDPYASENPAEFFAVLSELFFETPETLHEEYPNIYALFSRYYRQNPLLRQC